MANPLALPLSERIEEIQAEIDELIDGRVDELGASAAGVPRDWIRQSLFARNENKKLANSPGQVGKRLEAKQKKSRVALPRGLEPPSYGVEIRPPLVATIQRLPQRTIDSIFPTPGIASPCLAFHTPFGPSKTAVPPLT
jgi:hypothetical protein